MRGRAALASVAGLALIASCGRSERPPQPPAPGTAEAMVPPVAATTPTPSLAPSPEPSALPATVASASPTAQPLATYAPRDECAKLPGFAAFRSALSAASASRDADALVELADPDIHLDFGGGAGRDELRKRLLDTKSGLWAEIAALLALGCAADGTVATLPAIFARVPDDVDAGRTMFVTGSAVPLRSKPSPTAPELRKLDWALVTLAGNGFDPAARYARVAAADGSNGYVAMARLRSLLDYRLVADRGEGGAYRITALIKGD